MFFIFILKFKNILMKRIGGGDTMKKTIVITGGSDGLGKTLATDLAQESNVVIIATSEQKLKEVAATVDCDYYVCDVKDYYEVEKVMNDIQEKHGNIDILINNAGLWIQEELDENEIERIRDVFEVNLLGVIHCSKAVIPYMKANKNGLIININSQAGINYKAKRVVYNASKWGVTGFTKSLQPELAKYGIRVTDLRPGLMITNMFNKMNIDKNMNNGLDTKEVTRVIKFLSDTPKDVIIPEIGIKHIYN